MSEYQRIVSYLYEYNHGVKGANVGFARIEKRQNQIKVYFHVKTNEQALPYKIYFYHFHEGAMEGILLDSFQKSDSVIEMKLTYPLIVDLNEIDGFLIYHSNQLFFGSEWNDKPITIRNFLPLETQKTTPEKQPVENKPIEEPPVKIKPVEESPVEVKPTENKPLENDSKKSKPVDEKTPAVTSKLVEYIEALQLEKEAKNSISPSSSKDFDWKEYPSLSFCTDSFFDPCIKITLDDLVKLKNIPEKLPKNGFLLLNYGNYGHLMLGVHKKTGHTCLGVPGTFDNEKNFIAKFFGFESFITVPEKNQKTGNFGYWILPI
ncbi:MAG: DUF6128 domain-containing protein [Anaerostipes sp.]|nr:DUF6128 domain-containing protein [Anaerostipes sp.]